jgi:TRAP-type C4-dicarboxylate transport system substrate-binding protein
MIDELVQKGMTVTKDVDKTAFQAAMQPAFAEFAKQFGKEKIDAILNTK